MEKNICATIKAMVVVPTARSEPPKARTFWVSKLATVAKTMPFCRMAKLLHRACLSLYVLKS